MSCKGYIRAMLVPSRKKGFPFFFYWLQPVQFLSRGQGIQSEGPEDDLFGLSHDCGCGIWRFLAPVLKATACGKLASSCGACEERPGPLHTAALPILSRFHRGFPLPASWSGTQGSLEKAVGTDTRHPLPVSLVEVSSEPPSWCKQGASFLLVFLLYLALISHVSLYSKIPSLRLLAESYSEVGGALLRCSLWFFMSRKRQISRDGLFIFFHLLPFT